MKLSVHPVLNFICTTIVITAVLGPSVIVYAEPPATPKTSAAKQTDVSALTKKHEATDYAQGGRSMTGSHLPMLVRKYDGHYYVSSAFTARQIVVFDQSGMSSRVISVDEISNQPVNRPQVTRRQAVTDTGGKR